MKSIITDISTRFPARNYKNLKVLNACRDYISNKLKKSGFKTSLQTFTVKGRKYSNVIASYGPTKAPVFVVGAHYDVYGNSAGADDNASGVAGLLELARLLNHHKPKLKFRVVLVAYTLEEPPFFRTRNMGSYKHAQSLKRAGSQVKGMISIEMIGFYSDKKNSQKYPLPAMASIYSSTADFIGLVGNPGSFSLTSHFKKSFLKSSIKVESLNAPQIVTGIDFSDHLNYWKFGYTAFMITDTSFFRSPHYHENTDKPHTLDYKMTAKVIEGLYRALIAL